MDIVDDIMAFENGELTREETFSLFQRLVNSGVIHSLQGSYQRMAQDLIACGAILSQGETDE